MCLNIETAINLFTNGNNFYSDNIPPCIFMGCVRSVEEKAQKV